MRRRIVAAGGDPEAVRVVAVTKGFGPEAVEAALAAGLADIGENYAQELLAKARALRRAPPVGAGGGPPGAAPGVSPGAASGTAPGVPAGAAAGVPPDSLRWHFLGTVQRNKVPALAAVVACWQGVARAVEGEAIARRRPGAEVLVEVDLTGRRNGCAPEAVPSLVADLRSLELDVRGLMTVAPPGPGRARPAFRAVRELADRLSLPERSMGMSEDFEDAVAEGSTMVRIGRGLFGPRAGKGGRAPSP